MSNNFFLSPFWTQDSTPERRAPGRGIMSLFNSINANTDRRFQTLQQTSSFEDERENQNPTSSVSSFGFDGSQRNVLTPAGNQERAALIDFNGPGLETPSRAPTLSLNSPGCGSVLGRRQRSECLADWSPPTKARLTEYADSVASEYGITQGQREDLLAASGLSTHKLMIVTFAALLRGQQAEGAETLQTYLASSPFKEHVVGQVRDLFLDPKLSSYKLGFLSRLLRHIRLNPGTYNIPQEFRSFITTHAFTTAVSKAATTARSELKRKMRLGWKNKTCIYELVPILAWKSSQEMTDDIWARCAWLQMKLVDYEVLGKHDEFWDHIDTELANHRERALEQPADQRPAFTSFLFEETLKTHLRLCPATAKNRKKSSTRLPAWQVAISRAVIEMEMYSQEELAGEGDDDVDDENNETPTESA
ncbi:hypothetical protein C8R43DRAFT_1137352 [Mycena crocata]|nr:hypothetical protein C8R43DRAFT_1137352 [Mycena crocata]